MHNDTTTQNPDCWHELYAVENPRQVGWVVYCPNCGECCLGDTEADALKNWDADQRFEDDFDRMELSNSHIVRECPGEGNENPA